MNITEERLREIVQESIDKVILEMTPRPLKALDTFIAQAKEIHGDKYDYSKVKYDGTDNPVTIKCSKHVEFKQRPHHHLQGQGCPKCLDSHLERETAKALEDLRVEFKDEHPFGTQEI